MTVVIWGLLFTSLNSIIGNKFPIKEVSPINPLLVLWTKTNNIPFSLQLGSFIIAILLFIVVFAINNYSMEEK